MQRTLQARSEIEQVDVTATRPLNWAAAARSTATAWDLLIAVTARNMKVRYQGTVLSYVWWIARPLALGLVLYFALGRVLRLDIQGSDSYVKN